MRLLKTFSIFAIELRHPLFDVWELAIISLILSCEIEFIEEMIADCWPYIMVLIVSAVLFMCRRGLAERLSIVGVSIWLSYESVLGLLQFAGLSASNHGIYAITGSFPNPGPYGGFVAVCIAILLAAAYNWRNAAKAVDTWIVRLACAAVFWGVVVLSASMSRSAWGALALAVAVFCFGRKEIRAWLGNHKTALGLVVVAVVIIAVLAFVMKQDSAMGRFHIWEMELRAIADEPLTGHGYGMSMGSYGDAQADYFESEQRSQVRERIAGCPEFSFNEYFHLGMELGIPGMFAFVALIVSCFRVLNRTNSALAWGLVVWGVFAFGSYPLAVWQLCFMIAMIFGAALGYCVSLGKLQKRAGLVLAFVLIAAGTAVIYPDMVRRRDAVKLWHDEQVLADYGVTDGTVERLEILYPELKRDYRYLYDYGYALHKAGRYSESNQILREGAARSSDPMFYNIIGKNYEAIGDYATAENYWFHAHNMVPSRLYPYILLMEMYDRQGDTSAANECARKVMSMPVNEKNITMIYLRIKADKYLKKNE